MSNTLVPKNIIKRYSVEMNDIVHQFVNDIVVKVPTGVVQLNGKMLNQILNDEAFVNKIDSQKATQYLTDLLARKVYIFGI